MDSRLRVAIDSSLAWYDALCALHGVACRIEDGLWSVDGTPPPLHSAVKTLEPGIASERVVQLASSRGGVADSFGDLRLDDHGFELLFAARWIHRAANDQRVRELAPGWTRVTSSAGLATWTAHHDTTEVLLPELLDRASFQVLARVVGDELTAGAVLHAGTGAVSVSNVWSAHSEEVWPELVHNATALWPGRDLVGYELGTDLEAALATGFVDVGPQLVWLGPAQ